MTVPLTLTHTCLTIFFEQNGIEKTKQTEDKEINFIEEFPCINHIARYGGNGIVTCEMEHDCNVTYPRIRPLLGLEMNNDKKVYTNMPIIILSFSKDVILFSKKVGINETYEIHTNEIEQTLNDMIIIIQKQIIPSYILIHVDTTIQSHTIIERLLKNILYGESSTFSDSKLFICLIKMINKVKKRNQIKNQVDFFKPIQSYQLKNGMIIDENKINNEFAIVSFYMKDCVRIDKVKNFNQNDILDNGCYGRMRLDTVTKEMAFRLGYVKKYGA